jgi:DNA-binding beta-propeller fold protein YncE
MKINIIILKINKYRKWVVKTGVVIILITILGCSSSKKIYKQDNIVIFPPPPDTTRIQFLTTINGSKDIAQSHSFIRKLFLGEEKSQEIYKPFGICEQKDKIYVVDTKLCGIEIINLNNDSFENFIPSGFGKLKSPLNCTIDDEGYLYISDIERKDIVVFDKDLNYYTNIGYKLLEKPSDVFVYHDRVYISDLKSGKINVFQHDSDSYKFSFSFPDVSKEDTAFLHQPAHISVANDIIYVTDFGEFNIKKFQLDGKFIGVIGSYGDAHGQFVRPKGIAVDKENNLYVIDAGFENVQIFNPEGKVLMYFGGPYTGPGYLYLPIRMAIDYDNTEYFREYVDKRFDLKYVIYVTNQFGPDRVTVYGFVEPKKLTEDARH